MKAGGGGALLKSTRNDAQGRLKLSVKTTARSSAPPCSVVMDALRDDKMAWCDGSSSRGTYPTALSGRGERRVRVEDHEVTPKRERDGGG